MKNRVITISREFGSGGRTIGKKAAEELGIPCYDHELLTKIAQESGFQENYVQEAGEYAPGGFLTNAFSHRSAELNNADYLWQIQYRIISELAEKGPCVIVGRCADYILRDKADCLRVFIHADVPSARNASSRSTASGRNPPSSGYATRTSGARPITGSIRI